MGARKKNIIKPGQRFGILTVINEYTKINGYYKVRMVNCICDCGNKVHRYVSNLYKKQGSSKGCGCKETGIITGKKQKRTHNLSKTRIYRIWTGMKTRVNNVNSFSYGWYGARGIGISSEWMKFENFYDWAVSNGYNSNLTIDRIDNNGDYCSENCKWSTRAEQNYNKRTCVPIYHNGIKYNTKEFLIKFNLSLNKLKYYRKMGITDSNDLIKYCNKNINRIHTKNK